MKKASVTQEHIYYTFIQEMRKYRDCKKDIERMSKNVTKTVNYRDQEGEREVERSGEASRCAVFNIALTSIPFKCSALLFFYG